MFEIIFGIIGEIGLQIAGELLVELGFRSLAATVAERKKRNPVLAFIGYGFLGSIVGGVSLYLFPELLIDSKALEIANLLVTPLCAGLIMALVGYWLRRQGKETIRLDTFLYGYGFALTMALTRFYFAR